MHMVENERHSGTRIWQWWKNVNYREVSCNFSSKYCSSQTVDLWQIPNPMVYFLSANLWKSESQVNLGFTRLVANMIPVIIHPQAISKSLIVTSRSQSWLSLPFKGYTTILTSWSESDPKKDRGRKVLLCCCHCLLRLLCQCINRKGVGLLWWLATQNYYTTEQLQKHVKDLQIPLRRYRFHIQAQHTVSVFSQSLSDVNNWASHWFPQVSTPSAHKDKQWQKEIWLTNLNTTV